MRRAGDPPAPDPLRVPRAVVGAGQALAVRVDRRLDPVPAARLGKDAIDVGLDRRLGHEQPTGDLGIGEPSGNQGEYLDVVAVLSEESILVNLLRSLHRRCDGIIRAG